MAEKLTQERVDEIVGLIVSFCNTHLNDEYKEVCVDMLRALVEERLPLRQGKAAGWAAGVVYSVGIVNFLSDPSTDPFMAAKQVAVGMGISEATMMAKARIIRQSLDLIQFDPRWTVDSMLEHNPFVWMIELNGFMIDLRSAPYELQKQAFEAGLIPFIPQDRGTEGISFVESDEEDQDRPVHSGKQATQPH